MLLQEPKNMKTRIKKQQHSGILVDHCEKNLIKITYGNDLSRSQLNQKSYHENPNDQLQSTITIPKPIVVTNDIAVDAT